MTTMSPSLNSMSPRKSSTTSNGSNGNYQLNGFPSLPNIGENSTNITNNGDPKSVRVLDVKRDPNDRNQLTPPMTASPPIKSEANAMMMSPNGMNSNHTLITASPIYYAMGPNGNNSPPVSGFANGMERKPQKNYYDSSKTNCGKDKMMDKSKLPPRFQKNKAKHSYENPLVASVNSGN